MKLEKITLYPLQMPLVAHFETSFGRIYERECVLVKIKSVVRYSSLEIR